MRRQILHLLPLACLLFAGGCAQITSAAPTVLPTAVTRQPSPSPEIKVSILPTVATSVTTTPIVDTKNEILRKMQTLGDEFAKATLKPGWVHLYNEEIVDTENGTAGLPNVRISEAYYHLDDHLLAFEGVSFMKSQDGKIIQASVLKNNKMKNLTFDIENDVELFTPGLDGGVIGDFKSMLPDATRFGDTSIILENQPVQFFDLRADYSQPLPIKIYNQPIIGIEKKAYFKPDGGLFQRETLYILKDGTIRKAGSSNHFVVESGMEPPQTILNYLK